jgi:glycosyltransferase involved in cell wall biosynthesis
MSQKTKTNQRIAIYISSMQGGGAQRATLKTARGIAERGYQVDLVLAHATGPYLAEVPPSINIVDLKAATVATSLPALVRYLRKERPVAMLSALNYVNVVAILARRLAGVPVRLVISERNTASISTKKFLRARGRLLVPFLMKRFYPWADAIVAVSKGVGDDLAHFLHLPSERIRVIYNPIITPELEAKAKAAVTHPWFTPGQPPVVLAVGRLQRQKDFPTLLRAFASVREKRASRLLIFGEGPDHGDLEKQKNALGLVNDVCLPGFETNPYAYMANAAAFVLSSQWEGLPGVLIEALYCGAPLVSTDCPSGPREILADGAYGRLVPIGDVEQMAGAIEAALAGAIARPPAHSWRPFAINQVVDEYLALLVQ